MAFLSDLDFLSWAATIAAVPLAGFVAFLLFRDWRNHWKVSPEGAPQIVFLLGVFCLVGAANSYSPDENAPRKTVEGVVHFVGVKHGRHTYSEYICATSCQLTGGYALALDARASGVAKIGSAYTFTYLEHPTGNIYTGMSLEVIQIAAADSGQVLYALDLTNHPYRIALYLFDFLLLFSTIVLEFILIAKQDSNRSAGSESTESDEDDGPPKPGPISLHLESKDAN